MLPWNVDRAIVLGANSIDGDGKGKTGTTRLKGICLSSTR